jgi:cysteine synthase
MPEDLSVERAQTMKAFGAELVLTPRSGGMEYARDLASQMERDGQGRVLDQFANPDNPRAHYEGTGPEIWRDCPEITHFVAGLGTSGTLMGVGTYLKERNPDIKVYAVEPPSGELVEGLRVLDQFANPDNPRIHYETTGPEIWRDTGGRITHFVSAMGTTGTVTGVSRYLREQNPQVRIVGAQPNEGSRIPGIRKWPEEYLPKIYDPKAVDELVLVSQNDAEEMARRLAREEGIFAGISSAGACWVALQVAAQVERATIVFVVCDRGDRYLSTGVFPA